ncbi:plasmid pRiA4b ORF-3 family protein [Micromonospora sp. PPF5-17]|uniref:Plasmid pRiA4b ORF-3 family protein n=2 Tax=Micromonosporaceae TaxID=28056 RepID=A0ABX9WCE5_9ACTN|nr:plasmid pRiA4b ORF-3 family protein [Micromonospora sp. PPF5-17B]NES39009.1 plasmid pRiA4b ORF-3 family protein [Micromonospora solifontis]NES56583.1 plasmid pRiA4b ORF-3 family protein [Micromonospora sp. PPF5-6]RNL91976.1 plasmid pRiA4b ORF-3 family protein [Micromonospora solifontis]
MLTDLVDDASALAEVEDPLEAELAGAFFVAMAQSGGDETMAAFAGALVPAIESRGTRAALTLLTAIGAVAGDAAGPVAGSAQQAGARLTGGGVAAPSWADDLAQPLTAGPFTRLYDDQDTMSVLIGVFQRAGREHALMIMVDHQDCGAAEEIYLLGAEDLPTAVAAIHQDARADGVSIRTKKLGAPEFRWYVEQALEARAVHDEEDGPGDVPAGLDLIDGEDGPGYAPLAVLTRSRLEVLPPARRPRGATASRHASGRTAMDVLQQLAALIGSSGGPASFGLDLPAQRRAQPAKLPPKRKKSNGPAPVYQIKVSLRGAKPPIWRRLLVPGDITLNRLHQAILAAFGWHGDHRHVFDTGYGQFGRADRDLGHRSDGPVTLEQVAPAVKDKLRYTYDLGDDWEHDILVEKTTPADPAIEYPACVGGRRAAPPDDCGGIWGYQYLIEVLADPNHPEHQDRLKWLGLDDASQFTPDTFDLDQVNQRLRAR